ncbi:helix-turn-helix domain-containing protein [Mangrovimonas sp. CR14]|uniref:helix-turn-helix domain-containing protein n=1 Tax=Mangrovimonas sp. CR14 TaxID=2706120 RepID=UPI0014234B47|nr:helix-turn-helix domain-containing protein [Mangrovimonas sp. CR14]NIK91167.1 helix-turn-helix domain-containing protein [Mangrovimonas sp. CR14]
MAKTSLLLKEIKSLRKEVKNSTLFRKRIYTLKEASIVLGISYSQIQKLVSSKQIPYSKPTGKLIFIRRRDLEKFVMKNRIESEDEMDTIIADRILNLKLNSKL